MTFVSIVNHQTVKEKIVNYSFLLLNHCTDTSTSSSSMNKHSIPIQEEECINVEDVNLQESQFASAP